MKKLIAFLIVVCMLAVPCSAWADGEYNFTVAHTHAVGSLIDNAMNDLANRITEYTDGAVTFDFFPAGQLGDKITNMESIRAGTLSICEAAITDMSSFNDAWSVFCLPFLFDSSDECYEVYSNPTLLAALEEDLNEAGYHLLSFENVGARSLFSTKGSITSPDDCKGIKMRCLQDKYVAKTMELMGFSTISLGWTEVYTALQQGTVDAADNSAPLLRDAKMYEVAKYFSVLEAVRMPDIIIMSLADWNSLTPELQEKVNQACADYLKPQWDSYVAIEEDAIEEFKEKGVTVSYIDEAGLAAFKEAVQPVYDQMFEEIPAARELYELLVSVK